MIAASILLYCRNAFRTLLCVCGYPIGSLGIILTLLQPFLNKEAWAGKMVRVTTSKTELVATIALDSWNNCVQLCRPYRAIHCIFTVGGRTPSQIWLIVDISPVE